MSNPKKSILIRADGSHAIGLGHIFRMRTLATALKQSGYDVFFLTLQDETTTDVLAITSLPVFSFPADRYEHVLTHVLAEYRPDLIVQDILDTTEESIKMLRKLSSAKLIHFDDTRAGLRLADAVINNMVFLWNRYETNAVRTRLFEGPRYAILHPDIVTHMHIERPAPERVQKVLIAIGGTDTHFVTERVMQAFNTVLPSVSISINLGPGTKRTQALNMAVESSHHQVAILRSPKSLVLEILKHDLVICGGGTMLWELAALGVPSLCVATEPHEVFNMDYWAAKGTTQALGWEKHLCIERMARQLSAVLDNRERRIQMSETGKKVFDKNGVKRILEIIEETLN